MYNIESNQGKQTNVNNKVQYLAEVHFSSKENEMDTKFVCDSGATTHLECIKEIMSDLQETEETRFGSAKKKATLTSNMFGKVETDNVVLREVSYVPDLSSNLLSVNAVTRAGSNAVFGERDVKIINGEVP